jgi:hypothetical protein
LTKEFSVGGSGLKYTRDGPTAKVSQSALDGKDCQGKSTIMGFSNNVVSVISLVMVPAIRVRSLSESSFDYIPVKSKVVAWCNFDGVWRLDVS